MHTKRQWSDLAWFGGDPAFPAPLHVGRPNLGDLQPFITQLEGIWERAYLTNNGPLTQQFERRIAAICGAAHCVAMSSGTRSLEVAARAADLQGEVIVPALTFIGTAQAMSWAGLDVVFADVDPETLTINPRSVEQLITPRTSAVVGVHLFGQVCDVEQLGAICRRHQLQLLFDACHALGGEYVSGDPVGGQGACEVFSFHATKFVQSGEGGALVTNDDALAERAQLLRNFGFADVDLVTRLGTNAKLSELHAALGLCSLDRMDHLLEVNRVNRRRYEERLRDLPGLRLRAPTSHRSNDQYIVVEVGSGADVDRDTLCEMLQAEGVLARRYFYPGCHRTAPYRTARRGPTPVAEAAAANLLALPTGEAVAAEAIDCIAELLHVALTLPASIRRRLPWRAA